MSVLLINHQSYERQPSAQDGCLSSINLPDASLLAGVNTFFSFVNGVVDFINRFFPPATFV